MSASLITRLVDELEQLWLIDPHSHINPHEPASRTLADMLGYHYYTELVHSAGVPRDRIEQPGLPPDEKVRRIVEHLSTIDNTIQYRWLIDASRALFGFAEDRLTLGNWRALYDMAAKSMSRPGWADEVLCRSRLRAVFLTNDFDDPLTGFDTSKYIPCLRTDDLVFHLVDPNVRRRLEAATGASVDSAAALKNAIGRLFEHFVSHGARACAISLPPDFSPRQIPSDEAARAVDVVLGARSPVDAPSDSTRQAAQFVFWSLAEHCDNFRLPFDLMIGVNRNVYSAGVHQGKDLFDRRVSLIQYRELFNAFPRVTFPISVLATDANQELTSYSWIFPNVVAHGHWWYANTPAQIERDASVRLEAAPRTKQIGYYSDMYKLEFGLPKFGMYKRVLAQILADRFVIDRRWSEEQAVALGAEILRDNVERVFGVSVSNHAS